MKKRSCKKIRPLKFWLSLLTTFLLVTGELGAAVAYATPAEGVSENAAVSADSVPVQISAESTAGETEMPESPEVSGNGIVQEETGGTASENSTVSANEEETAGAENNSESEKSTEEEMASGEEEADSKSEETAAGEESVSGNTVSENALGELTEDQKETAEVLKEELEKIDRLEEGRDYVPNEAVFMADTRSQAENVAEQYGASLKSFSYGVATIEFNEENKIDTVLTDVVDTVDAVQTAAEIIEEKGDETASIETVAEEDEELAEKVAEVEVNALPDTPVYTNYIYTASAVNATSAELNNSWQHGSDYLNTEAVWESSGVAGDGVIVAVLDTGINSSHLEFSGQLKSSDYVSGAGFSSGADDHGHGTHVAGIIAAAANGNGMVGVAPNAKIYSVKVLNSEGSGDTSTLVKGIKKAIKAGADVINMSLGGSAKEGSSDTTLQEEINKAANAGIVCVAAAGNGDESTDSVGTSAEQIPACLDNVIAVAAYDKSNNLADYSYFGDSWVDIAAPGSEIYSTSKSGGYVYMSGTSMATPMVSAAAALVMSKNTSLRDGNNLASAEKVAEILTKNKNSKTYYSSKSKGSVTGGLDIAAALKAAASATIDTTTPETSTPETSTPVTPTPVTQNGKLNIIKGQKANVSSAISGSYARYIPADKSVVSVTSKGVVTGKNAGSTTITVYTKSGKEYTSAGTVTVYVDEPKLEKMNASYYGQTISARSVLSGCHYTSPDSWKSSKPAVASVDSSGNVTALKAGSATISAIFGNKKVSATIKVKIPKFSNKQASILLGGSVTRKVSNVPSGSAISWDYNSTYLSKVDSGTYGAKFTLIRATSEAIPVTAKIDGREVGTFNIRMSKTPSLSYPRSIKSGKTGTFKVKNIKVTDSNNVKINWSAGNNLSLVSSGRNSAKFMATGNPGSYGSVTVSLPGASYTIESIYIK